MVIIVCLDQKNGMMFNQRRLSRDKRIIEDIYDTLLDAPLSMNEYSSELFREYQGELVVDSDFMNQSTMFCFVETSNFNKNLVDEIIVYRFDTTYPADTYLPLDLNEYVLMDEERFPGNSHDFIQKEVYSRII